VRRPKQVTPDAEQISDEAVDGQESLGLRRGLEQPHLSSNSDAIRSSPYVRFAAAISAIDLVTARISAS
jgi:hypothetical protein